jgi:hypothetical protein
MEESLRSTPPSTPPSGLIRLQASPVNSINWLGPLWASLCGVIASGGFGWQGQDGLRFALLILLVDGGWGTLWKALASTDWTTPLKRWRQWRMGNSIALLPYTLPGSPGARVARWLGELHTWWRECLWPACGPAISAILITLPVAALLATLLGPSLLLMSLVALSVMQLGLAWEGGRGIAGPGWNACIAVALPWIAGHIAFGPITLRSAGMAALFAMAWGSTWRAKSGGGRLLMIGTQLLAMAYLILSRHPITTGGIALLLIPQLALLPWLRHGQLTIWYVRHTRPWLMGAMLAVAMTL